MANIIEAQKQREEGTPRYCSIMLYNCPGACFRSIEGILSNFRASTGIPPRQLPKHRRKLNDLNVNDESDSDSEEYKANE